MHTTLRAREGLRQTIAVELDGEEVTSYLHNFYLVKAQEAGLKPEAGMTARQLIERDLDADEVGRAASETVVMRAVPLVLDQAGVDAVGIPDFGCHGYAFEGMPFAFDVMVVLKPEIELNSYGSVELPSSHEEVTEGDVDDFVARVAQYHPDSVEDETQTEVAVNSLVRLGMETEREGERFEPLCFDEREYQLGNHDMPDGFDESIVGMKVGEARVVKFKAEGVVRDENGVLPVNSFKATVTVNAILKQVEPVINDAWVARNITGCSTLRHFRDKAREELQQQASSRSRDYLKFVAADELSKRLASPVPDEVFAAYYTELLQDFRRSLALEDLDEQSYLEQRQMTADELRRELMGQARGQLRQGLALDAMARHMQIEISKAEIKAYLDQVSQGQGNELLDNLKANGGLRRAREAALRAKVNEMVVEG